jgi:hypothetical protein
MPSKLRKKSSGKPKSPEPKKPDSSFPSLTQVTSVLDGYLRNAFPAFFGTSPKHPFQNLKPYKIIHDPLWGTNRYSWRELALIDTPILQRLRYIHQTGLAHQVYPTAHHTRFDHSLGVVTIASRIFDALAQHYNGDLPTVAATLGGRDFTRDITREIIAKWRQELRIAALLHDTGHSIHSHASERVYSSIPLLERASSELTVFAGRRKGAGEVLSYCMSKTPAIRDYLTRCGKRVVDLPPKN